MTIPEYRQHRYTPPAGSTTIVLVRHGASAPARADQPFPLVNGHGDPELAPEGVAQAKLVCDRLAAGPEVEAIYVTPLRRTSQTAAQFAAHTGLTPVVVDDLVEVHLGEWEAGLYRQRVAEGHPLAVRMNAEQRWDVIPGAESTEHLRTRVRRGINQIAAAHPGGRVAVFTHGGVIGQIIADATASRPFAFMRSDNCAISMLAVTEAGWVVMGFNDTSHLDG
ncbi:MAG TPA: histidine phosphatase family protein [Pseudonocardiaceae bacterium]|nr:histidine phosphatase family protein [Pseudonocardiaceae bacterium]